MHPSSRIRFRVTCVPGLNEVVRAYTDLDDDDLSGCTCSSPTGRSSPTCRSPTWCSGCPIATGTATGAARRCARRPGRPRSSTTWSAPSSRAGVGRCSTPRSTRAGSRARVTPSGVTTSRCGSRPSRCSATAAQLGVVARNTNLLGVRTPSRLELSYLQTASDLTRMISIGRFPNQVERREWSVSPQVGDGFVRTTRRRHRQRTRARTRSRPIAGSG